jgi:hypothetical protein
MDEREGRGGVDKRKGIKDGAVKEGEKEEGEVKKVGRKG